MVTTANTKQATGSPRSTGAEYAAGIDDVTKVRAFVSGKVTGYVRRLGGHDNDDYTEFSEGAYYLPAVPRTLDAFAGLVMTPEPLITDNPTAFDTFLDDLTTDGEPFQRVAFTTVEEVSATGRYCLLVDYPDVAGAADMTRLEAERSGLRPFVKGYGWEDILAVRSEVIGGVRSGRRTSSSTSACWTCSRAATGCGCSARRPRRPATRRPVPGSRSGRTGSPR